jgi:hypothetical protein
LFVGYYCFFKQYCQNKQQIEDNNVRINRRIRVNNIDNNDNNNDNNNIIQITPNIIIIPVLEINTHLYSDISNVNNCTFCTICQTEYENNDKVIILRCNHIHHEHCLKTWFNEKPECPVCKYNILSNINI